MWEETAFETENGTLWSFKRRMDGGSDGEGLSDGA